MTFTTINLNDSSEKREAETTNAGEQKNGRTGIRLIFSRSASSDSADNEKKRSWFYRRVVRPAKKNPLIAASILLLSVSTLFLFILLVGGNSIYLTRFEFDGPIQYVTKKKSLTFTLYGYCVDDKCSDRSMSHDPSTMPSNDEIAQTNQDHSSRKLKKRFDVGQAAGDAYNTGKNGAESAYNSGKDGATSAYNSGKDGATSAYNSGKDGAENAYNSAKESAAVNHAEEFGNELLNDAKDLGQDAIDKIKEGINLLKDLLKGLADFLPKHPIEDLLGLISTPYVVAFVSNIIALALLSFKFPSIAFVFVALSTIMNALAFGIDLFLFEVVFGVVGLIPGIGDNHKGPAMFFAGWSLFFLFIAFIITGIKFYYMFCCGGGARLCVKNTKKYTKKGVSKLRKRMDKRGHEMQQQQQEQV